MTDFDPMSPEDLAKALELIAESDACENNTMLSSILLVSSSVILSLSMQKHDVSKLVNALALVEEMFEVNGLDKKMKHTFEVVEDALIIGRSLIK